MPLQARLQNLKSFIGKNYANECFNVLIDSFAIPFVDSVL